MGRVCKEIQEWIEEQVEKPIETWENQQEKRCREEECNWWMLCLNKLFCWLVWVLVKVIRWVVVTVGKWVTRVVCEIVNVVLDVIGWIVTLILAIPIIGYIYSPFEVIPDYAFPTRFIFLPAMVLTGLWMWKGHLVRRLFAKKPADAV